MPFRLGGILLLGAAAIALVAMALTMPPDELWPLLARSVGIGAMSGISVLLLRVAPRLELSWRGVFWGIVKGLVALLVAVEVIFGLTGRSAGLSERATALLVILMSGASLAYLPFVSSRMRLRLPGVVEGLTGEDPQDEAHRTETADEMETIEIVRRSSQAARMTVVNDAPLPVLRAQASVTIVHEPDEGRPASTAANARPTMGPPFSLRAHAARPVTLGNAFAHVGIYRLHSAGVRVYGPFGLLSRMCILPGCWRVRVVPNIYRIPYGVPRDRTLMQASLGLPDSPADALDYDRVRDYRPGDPLKTIHWKLVAHSQGELLTKLFETPTVTAVTLTIDPFGADAESLGAETVFHLHDTLLEASFSLIEHARENGIAGRLRFVRRDGTLVEVPWAGPALRGWFVETAQRPGSTREDATRSIIALQAMRNAREGYALFATSCLAEASVEALIACRQAGTPLLVVHALPTSGTERTRQLAFDGRLRAASITVFSLTDGAEIVREVSA